MPFLPGNNANPLGRPKSGETWAECIERALAEKDQKTGKTRKQLIIQKVMELADQGKEWAVTYLTERTDGKAAVQVTFQTKKSPLANMSDDEIAQAIEALRRQKEAIDVTPAEKPEVIKALEQSMPRPTDL